MTGDLHLVGDDDRADRPGGPPASSRLIALAESWSLFHDERGDAYAAVPVDGHEEVHRLRSRSAMGRLRALCFDREGRPAPAKALEDALGVLEAKATFDGPCERVAVRVAGDFNRIAIDLGTPAWEAVVVEPGRWRVVDRSPVRFRRPATLRPLPLPERGGTLDDLWELVNVPPEARPLVLGWLVGCFHPRGPYPLIVIAGEQGSAKSSTCRTLRALVDPAEPALRTAPRDERDLLIAATAGWVTAFDNLSGISPVLSDALCRLATGGGLATRRLFTDDEEAVFAASRPALLNGIDVMGSRPDLLDRSIVVELPRLARVVEERHLAERFRDLAPYVVGALFDAVAQALADLPKIILKDPPRMADFAAWVVAAEPALPVEPGAFLNAYMDNRRTLVETALGLDPLAAAVRQLVETTPAWTGTYAELLTALRERADAATLHARGWPETPRRLASALRRLGPGLRSVGVEVVEAGHGRDGYRVELKRSRTMVTPVTSSPAPDSKGACA